MSAHEGKWAFFKQGGWMVMATGITGVCMILVHTITNQAMNNDDYALFGALLKFFLLMGIPAAGLQTVFAHQAAAAVTPEARHQLARVTRVVLAATFTLWLLAALGILLFQKQVCEALKITTFSALAATLLLGLPALWVPLFRGLLQGRQQFGGYGLSQVLEGIVRIGLIAILIKVMHGGVASAMSAALVGQLLAVAIGLWLTRDILRGTGAPFAWRPWLRVVIPLSLGSAAMYFVFLVDNLFVQSVFASDKRALYTAGQNSGFALNQIAIPLSIVMFSKIAHSAARSEKSGTLALTLKSTLSLGGAMALVCTIMPSLPLRLVYFFSYEKVAPAGVLVPWSVWTMLILSVANVLSAGLLARKAFAIVPWMVVLAVAYGATLWSLQGYLLSLELFTAFRTVIQVQMLFSLLLLVASIWYSRPSAQVVPAATPAA